MSNEEKEAYDKYLKCRVSVRVRVKKKNRDRVFALALTLTLLFVPGAELFYEPFLEDLELIWRVDISPSAIQTPP
jgi:hypothetical protein